MEEEKQPTNELEEEFESEHDLDFVFDLTERATLETALLGKVGNNRELFLIASLVITQAGIEVAMSQLINQPPGEKFVEEGLIAIIQNPHWKSLRTCETILDSSHYSGEIMKAMVGALLEISGVLVHEKEELKDVLEEPDDATQLEDMSISYEAFAVATEERIRELASDLEVCHELMQSLLDHKDAVPEHLRAIANDPEMPPHLVEKALGHRNYPYGKK